MSENFTTIKVFGLREYDEVILSVSRLPLLQDGLRVASKPGEPLATTALNVLRNALFTPAAPASMFSDKQVAENIAYTVFVFASQTKDPAFDAVNGNFILVEATIASFGCAIYRHHDEEKFRHDLPIARMHFERYHGQVPPRGPRGTMDQTIVHPRHDSSAT